MLPTPCDDYGISILDDLSKVLIHLKQSSALDMEEL